MSEKLKQKQLYTIWIYYKALNKDHRSYLEDYIPKDWNLSGAGTCLIPDAGYTNDLNIVGYDRKEEVLEIYKNACSELAKKILLGRYIKLLYQNMDL